MAIKSWDPHKLQDHAPHGSRFEHAVMDAWDEAHERTQTPPETRQANGSDAVPRDYRDEWAATHNPFNRLRDRLLSH